MLKKFVFSAFALLSASAANAAVATTANAAIVADLTPITSAGTQVALIGGAILLVVLAIKGWQMLKRV